MITLTATTEDTSRMQSALSLASSQSAVQHAFGGAMENHAYANCYQSHISNRWQDRDYRRKIEQASRKVSAA